MKNKMGFIFIETIIVICVLTVSLMSLYGNYSKIIANTKELNTFDTAEYNYKTYFLLKMYVLRNKTNKCFEEDYIPFSDDKKVIICPLYGIVEGGRSVEEYINTLLADTEKNVFLDAYIIDYLLNQDFTEDNDDIFLVEYKKEDKQNGGEYLTYISSLNF